MVLEFYRAQNPSLGDTFTVNPSLLSQSPAASTTNRLYSPNKVFSYESDPTNPGGTSVSYIKYTLDDVINECTNGLWTLSINDGSPTQQVYTFQVSITGLTTNTLKAAKILCPTNGATVFSHPPFTWVDPTNFTAVDLTLYGASGAPYGGTEMPGTATSWLSAPALVAGYNGFGVNFVYSNVTSMVSFTTPVDTNSNPVEGWSTLVNLHSTASTVFTVTNAPPPAATMLNPKLSGSDFQFSFQSQNGAVYTVLSRTNLQLGQWRTNVTVLGDGTFQSITLAETNKQQFFRLQEN
jgi:hypothetical protein